MGQGLKRLAGWTVALASASFALLVVGVEVGAVRRLPFHLDPRLVAAPFLGLWPVAVPIAAMGVWAGLDLAMHARRRAFLATIPSAIIALGLAMFVYGLVQSRLDCSRLPPDGLCFLIGTFICFASIGVLAVGAVAMLVQAFLIRRGGQRAWETPAATA